MSFADTCSCSESIKALKPITSAGGPERPSRAGSGGDLMLQLSKRLVNKTVIVKILQSCCFKVKNKKEYFSSYTL